MEVRGQLARVSSLLHHTGSGDLSQVIRVGDKRLYPFNHVGSDLSSHFHVASGHRTQACTALPTESSP